jgi:hypothetical protein
MTDISEARRSRQYLSYKFYRNFYENHKDDKKVEKTEKRKKAIAVSAFDDELLPPVPFQQYNGSTVLDAWSGRRVIEWLCGSRDAKAL